MATISRMKSRLLTALVDWLNAERERMDAPTYDFEWLRFEIRPGDVILVEGRSRTSDAIQWITLSPWTHAALYIGRLHDIADAALRRRVASVYSGDPSEQLLIEAVLGQGTVVNSLDKYRRDHVRICRPVGLTPGDAQRVIGHAILQLGRDYDLRQILDLARFLFPWSVVPRRWRSTLFHYQTGAATRTVCSSLIARAFMNVGFPILPVVTGTANGQLRFHHRNARLFTPRDFDFSPYFNIIKYPVMSTDDRVPYRALPWDQEGLVCNAPEDCFVPQDPPGSEPVS